MKPRNQTWQQFWADNVQWLLASLLLAFGIWIVAVTESDPADQRTYPRSLPIEFRTSDGMVYNDPNVETAQLTIRAPSSQWDELRADQIRIIADLRDLNPGRHRVELHGELADEVSGRVVQVVPGSIQVTVAELGQQRVPVQVEITQEPPSGYSYSEPTCELQEVTAIGPSALLEGLVATARISLRDARNTISPTVSLFAMDANGRTINDVTLNPTQITCDVEVTQNEGVTELYVRPNITGFTPAGYIYEGYEVEPRTVIVSGRQSAIRELNDTIETTAIPLTDATSTFQQSVELALPEGVYLEPPNQMITVTVRIGTIRGSRQYTDIPLELEGLVAGFQAEALPTTVSVFVVGPRPLLRDLNPENMRVYIDLSNFNTPGSYQLNPQVAITIEDLAAQVDEDTEITVQPAQVTVTVSQSAPPDD